MKRKKPPVALISMLVVAFIGLVIAGPGFAFFSKSEEEKQALLQKQAMEEARANAKNNPVKINASDAVNELKAATKASATNKRQEGKITPKPTDPASATGAPPSEVPTMVMPDDEVQKPKPNDSAPSSQWYGSGK